MSPLLRQAEIPAERPWWLAGGRIEPPYGGIKIQVVRVIYQWAFRKIAEIRPQTDQEVSCHFGMAGRGAGVDWGAGAPGAAGDSWRVRPRSTRRDRAAAEVVTRPDRNTAHRNAALPDRHGGLCRCTSLEPQAASSRPRCLRNMYGRAAKARKTISATRKRLPGRCSARR